MPRRPVKLDALPSTLALAALGALLAFPIMARKSIMAKE